MSETQEPYNNKIKKTHEKIEYPSYYNVILYEDKITPCDFVQAILTVLFNKNADETATIISEIYSTGKGIAGSYVKEIAVTKQVYTERNAKNSGFPLTCLIELSNPRK